MKSLDWFIEAIEMKAEEDGTKIRSIRTFEEAGLMTRNEGIVVEFENGEEYQITIILND